MIKQLHNRRIVKNHQILISSIVLLILIGMGIFAGVLTPYEYTDKDLGNRLQAPSPVHLFGTDQMGRDVLTMIMYGARASLFVGFVVVLASLGIGVILGLLSGYYGGWIDEILMRITDCFLSFPSMFLALGITAFLGQGMGNMIVALIIVEWTVFARVTRSAVLEIKTKGFVHAAKWIGASDLYTMWHHILPHVIAPVLIMATVGIGNVILAAAGLSFLGLGVQPVTPEWGAMLNAGRTYISSAPHLMLFPGLFIMITVFAFNYLGDGIRDAIEVKKKKRTGEQT